MNKRRLDTQRLLWVTDSGRTAPLYTLRAREGDVY